MVKSLMTPELIFLTEQHLLQMMLQAEHTQKEQGISTSKEEAAKGRQWLTASLRSTIPQEIWRI